MKTDSQQQALLQMTRLHQWQQHDAAIATAQVAGMNAVTEGDALIRGGWKYTHEGRWQDAIDCFAGLIEAPFDQATGYLGLGRIATRLGYWRLAVHFLYRSQYQARENFDDIQQAMSHGALGELCLRAGLSDDALLHMQTAYTLYPVGHPDRQRQYTYLAMPLARLKQSNIAEDYLMRAFILGIDRDNHEQAGHALVRRAALTLQQRPEVWQECLNLIKKNRMQLSGVTAGYQCTLAFWRDWNTHNNWNTDQLNRALCCFPAGCIEHRLLLLLAGEDAGSNPSNVIFPACPAPADEFRSLPLYDYLPEKLPLSRPHTADDLRNALMHWFI